MKKKPVNVNLGCGNHIMPGWLNIDNYYVPDNKDFLKADARDLPLESNSVDYIICDQVLEHMAMSDVPIVLYNIKRVLKVGGTCVIIVPDFEDAVNQWLESRPNLGFNPMTYKWFSEVIYGNQEHEGEFHKTPMCAGYLNYVLHMVGLPKHEIVFHAKFTPIPKDVPGMRPYPEGAILRNAQLIAYITKT
jgi:predicted SAM-dependent methyltransferase